MRKAIGIGQDCTNLMIQAYIAVFRNEPRVSKAVLAWRSTVAEIVKDGAVWAAAPPRAARFLTAGKCVPLIKVED